jgi:hypothetical protein
MERVSENETLEDKQQFSDAQTSLSVMIPKMGFDPTTIKDISAVSQSIKVET